MASFLDKDGLEYLWNKIKPWIPKKTSDIQNDSGFISTETDPTVPSWAKEATKPSYTAAEVGASEAGHTHDDRYYTESEMDTALAGKSDTGHDHDDRYYTETEMDTALAGKSDTGHDHDDRYYTELEMDAVIGKIKPITQMTQISGSFKATAADTWQYNGGQFTVPSGHIYLVRPDLGWSSGKPVGVGLNFSTTIGAPGFPYFNVENANGFYNCPTFLCFPATYYMFEKRATVPTAANPYYINAIDINMGGI